MATLTKQALAARNLMADDAAKLDSTKQLLAIGYNNYQELYLDWANNFLTVDGFADHHHIDSAIAAKLIDDASYIYK